MSDYDDSTEHNISGEIRVYPCNTVDGHRARCLGARLHLGNAWHLPCLAERVSCFVRCGLEHAAHQHRAHGTGFLSAVMVFGRHRIGSGRPRYSLAEGNSPPRYLGEKVMMKKTVERIVTAVGLLAMSAS